MSPVGSLQNVLGSGGRSSEVSFLDIEKILCFLLEGFTLEDRMLHRFAVDVHAAVKETSLPSHLRPLPHVNSFDRDLRVNGMDSLNSLLVEVADEYACRFVEYLGSSLFHTSRATSPRLCQSPLYGVL